ncbi:MAG: hypothetical protein L0207_07030 [Chlamydiae bacterium]|nr:hypothetical protein [Chlamydiota bacterium]
MFDGMIENLKKDPLVHLGGHLAIVAGSAATIGFAAGKIFPNKLPGPKELAIVGIATYMIAKSVEVCLGSQNKVEGRSSNIASLIRSIYKKAISFAIEVGPGYLVAYAALSKISTYFGRTSCPPLNLFAISAGIYFLAKNYLHDNNWLYAFGMAHIVYPLLLANPWRPVSGGMTDGAALALALSIGVFVYHLFFVTAQDTIETYVEDYKADKYGKFKNFIANSIVPAAISTLILKRFYNPPIRDGAIFGASLLMTLVKSPLKPNEPLLEVIQKIASQ